MAASIAHVFSQMQRWTAAQACDVSDAVLLERYIHRREEAAFAALVARHGAMVLRLCRRVLGDAHAAEDALQATFLILARKAPSLKHPDSLPAWLYGVARRVALKARGQWSGRAAMPLDEALPDPRPDPLTQLTGRELLDILDEEVQRLPAAQRSAFVLCYLEGHTQDEAARILGCTAGSIKGRLERGRRRLHARLQRRGIALSAALALVAVSRSEAAPALLLRSTITAALGGGLSSPAASLAASVLKAMLLSKLAGTAAVVLTIALATSAAVALIYRVPATEPPQERTPVAPLAAKAAEAPKETRTDALGDPLPKGAIARLGTVRFRHGGRIDRLLFTADGKHLVSKGDDGVRVWDTATGKELRHLTPPPGENWAQATDLSADGEQLAVVHGPDSAIDFWDVRRGKKIDSFGRGDYSLVCLSPDGKWAAVCAKLSGIELWDVSRREKLRSWKAHKWQVWSLVFTADSRRLLTSDPQGKIRLWDVATGRQLHEFTITNYLPLPNLTSPLLSPDGSLLAIIEGNEKPTPAGGATPQKPFISLWDTTTGKQLQQLICPDKGSSDGCAPRFDALTFTPDGKRLVTSGRDHILRIWDLLTGKELRKVPFDQRRPTRPSSVLALSKDGKTLAAVLAGMTIRLLDVPSGKAHEPPEGDAMAISYPYWSVLTPDGRTAITSSWDNAPLVWDVATGRIRQQLEKHNGFIRFLRLSGDGKTLFSLDVDKVLRLWDLSRGEERLRVQLNFKCEWFSGAFVLAPDSRSLFLADTRGIIHQLDAATGKERSHFQGPQWLWGLACSPDGRSLVGWSGDRKIRVWDAANGRLQHEYTVPENIKGKYGFAGPNGGMVACHYSAALSPDGRLLAMGSLLDQNVPTRKQQYALIFKDLSTGRDIAHCDPLPAAPEVLAFSPDGRMLAWSGSFLDPTVHLVEVASGRERCRLVGHRGRVNTLHFSARGERLLSASEDTTALVWDLGSDRARCQPTAAELEALWTDLAGENAPRAYQAIHKLAAAPKTAIPFLRKHLRPALIVDARHLARLIADLDSDDFAIRQKATVELEKLGEQALPAYRKALDGKPSLESRRRLNDLLDKAQRAWWGASGERLRLLRAIEALELTGTKEAREVLKTLAAGAAGARLTEEAKAALERLTKKRP